MRGRWLFAAIFAGVVTAFTIALLTQNSALARTELSITEIRWFNFSPEDSWQPIQFIVPDRNTAKSANGGKLRLYDVHIAKMFEISHFLCDRDRASEGYDWSYEAENGNIEMGRFKISCNLARSIAAAYGLGQPEILVIRRNFNLKNGRPSLAIETYSIPTLNIAKNRVLQWRDFVQKFPPQSQISQVKTKLTVFFRRVTSLGKSKAKRECLFFFRVDFLYLTFSKLILMCKQVPTVTLWECI